MPDRDYVGLLCIGDPHLEGRTPGHRKDEYPAVILDKLAWCLDYAEQNRLLPAILGDLFDKPRDNPNWMLVKLIEMLNREVIGLYGNHDCADPELKDHDSLSVLVRSGRLQLVGADCPWRGTMNGRGVVVGGSSYRKPIPQELLHESSPPPLAIWLTHHDLAIPGYEETNWLRPHEIPGIDLVINGHIHQPAEPLARGQTVWLNPGNISRRSRSARAREHIPAALRIDVSITGWSQQMVTIPHRPFAEVFHEQLVDAPEQSAPSSFIAGLAELQSRRTQSGAGLMEFLSQNMNQFEKPIADELLLLAQETLTDAHPQA
jgi:DNA repair exonuclease SbcCD nuclease subunit